jgi:hypothetical protein
MGNHVATEASPGSVALDPVGASLLAQVQRNNPQMTQLKLVRLEGAVKVPMWSEIQLAPLFDALLTNTHVTTLSLDGQSALQSPQVMLRFSRMLIVASPRPTS